MRWQNILVLSQSSKSMFSSFGPDWLSRAIRRRVGIDTRALGVVRIGLGVLLLLDLLFRTLDLRAHYTDAGLLPRWGLLVESGRISLHLAVGSVAGMAVLFALQAIIAIAFLIGYRTRVTTVLVWLLWTSLHARMPLVLNGGDALLRLILFWAIFAPMGERFSVDAIRHGKQTEQAVTIGTVALLSQVVVMYGANAILKHSDDVWPRGDGIPIVMTLDMFTTPLGDLLSQFPQLMTALSLGVLGLWTFSPLLLLTTGWLRAALVALFASFHLGMFFTMHLGLFPLIVVVVLALFLPPVVWERLLPDQVEGWTPRFARLAASDWYLTVSLENERLLARLRRGVRYGMLTVAVVSVVFVGLWNIQTTASTTGDTDQEFVPEPLADYGRATMLAQHWNMFAPTPVRADGWYVIPATLANGTVIDLYRGGGTPSYSKPEDVAATYQNQRWRKYLQNLRQQSYTDYRLYYGRYLCREYNRNHDVTVQTFNIEYVKEQTTLAGRERPVENVTLWEHDCFA